MNEGDRRYGKERGKEEDKGGDGREGDAKGKEGKEKIKKEK